MIVLCRIAHVKRVRWGSSILTIGQGWLEDKRPLIQPLCSRFGAVALGPPLFLARWGLRWSGRRFCFQHLDARCEILHVLGELGGEVVDLWALPVEGLHEQQHRFHLRSERIQFLLRHRHGMLGLGVWVWAPASRGIGVEAAAVVAAAVVVVVDLATE